ncbi:MAG TPA: hypothetical protein VIJ97_03605 [Candidatus Anoxymicrobiaceae bacterium]
MDKLILQVFTVPFFWALSPVIICVCVVILLLSKDYRALLIFEFVFLGIIELIKGIAGLA